MIREKTVQYVVQLYDYGMIKGEFGFIGYLEYEKNCGPGLAKLDEIQSIVDGLVKLDEEYSKIQIKEFDDIQKLIDLVNFKTKYMLPSLGSKEGFEMFFEYLRQEFKEGKKEFRISFLNAGDNPTQFYIHPLGKDGKTLDLVLTNAKVI